MKRLMTSLMLSAGMVSLSAAHAVERGDVERGEDLALACMACHSAQAVENNPEWPRLHGQHSDYLLRAMRDYKSGKRDDAIMRQQMEHLSLQDKRDLAAWFASQDGELYTPRQPR